MPWLFRRETIKVRSLVREYREFEVAIKRDEETEADLSEIEYKKFKGMWHLILYRVMLN